MNDESDKVILTAYTIHNGVIRSIGQWPMKEKEAIDLINAFESYINNKEISSSERFNIYDGSKLICINFNSISMIDVSLPSRKIDEIKAKEDTTIPKEKKHNARPE